MSALIYEPGQRIPVERRRGDLLWSLVGHDEFERGVVALPAYGNRVVAKPLPESKRTEMISLRISHSPVDCLDLNYVSRLYAEITQCHGSPSHEAFMREYEGSWLDQSYPKWGRSPLEKAIHWKAEERIRISSLVHGHSHFDIESPL